MGKGYRAKTCVYCARQGLASTADHVFARQFFKADERNNLPKVPSCVECNRSKSRLEHYLASVLPFGAQHSDASAMLNRDVPSRLSRNAKLARELASGQKRIWRRLSSGLVIRQTVIPFDGKAYLDLFVFILKGMAFYHWNYIFPSKSTVKTSMVRGACTGYLNQMLSWGGNRVYGCLGDGLFEYEAVQSVQEPQISIWRFGVFGGLEVAGDLGAPGEIVTDIWGATNPPEMGCVLDP